MKKILFILAAAFICLGYVKEVKASGEVSEILEEELLGDMDFARVQEMMDDYQWLSSRHVARRKPKMVELILLLQAQLNLWLTRV